jgi:hypothetical protein
MGLIVLGLSIYLGTLFSKLKAQKISLDKERLRIEAKVQEHKDSIVMIAKATLQEQCDPAESCIRIYNLLTFIDIHESYPVTLQYFSQIDSLSVLKQRKELSAKAAFEEDKVRFKAEEEYKDLYYQELNLIIQDLS